MGLPSDPPLTSADVVRGTCRMLWLQGWSPLTEVTLADGHRADILAVSRSGEILILEIKVSAADLKGDRKWHHYRDYADRFGWAVPPHLAGALDDARFAPEACGLVVADRHEALWVREPCASPLAAARRKAMMLMLARLGAERLLRTTDAGFDGFQAY